MERFCVGAMAGRSTISTIPAGIAVPVAALVPRTSSPVGTGVGFKRRDMAAGLRPGGAFMVRAAAADDVGTIEGGEKATLQSLSKAVESKDADAVRSVLDELKQAGTAKEWNALSSISRRTTFIRELTTLGIKNAENLAIPSVRNDIAFLATVVGITSLLAVISSQLPGDWGFFVPYLVGSISLVVLAVGSIAPGLLQAGISSFSSIYPDYQERLLRHEAAHFFVAYLVGLPIVGYSIDIGKEHVNLLDEKLQERIYSGSFDARELDKLAVVSMAGLAAEGLKYEKVEGQSADLYSLQRLINRSNPPLSNSDQQNLTRWAVLYAASLLKNNVKAFEALQQAMGRKASVVECIEAIEKA
ncbi:unnamed protein product [Calypogeia fissa]